MQSICTHIRSLYMLYMGILTDLMCYSCWAGTSLRCVFERDTGKFDEDGRFFRSRFGCLSHFVNSRSLC